MPPAMEPLIKALRDPVPYVRQWAAYALRLHGDGRAVEALMANLRDPHPGVRLQAILCLWPLGDGRGSVRVAEKELTADEIFQVPCVG